jgi:hypothetical protein
MVDNDPTRITAADFMMLVEDVVCSNVGSKVKNWNLIQTKLGVGG